MTSSMGHRTFHLVPWILILIPLHGLAQSTVRRPPDGDRQRLLAAESPPERLLAVLDGFDPRLRQAYGEVWTTTSQDRKERELLLERLEAAALLGADSPPENLLAMLDSLDPKWRPACLSLWASYRDNPKGRQVVLEELRELPGLRSRVEASDVALPAVCGGMFSLAGLSQLGVGVMKLPLSWTLGVGVVASAGVTTVLYRWIRGMYDRGHQQEEARRILSSGSPRYARYDPRGP